jgi:hypothetical protein
MTMAEPLVPSNNITKTLVGLGGTGVVGILTWGLSQMIDLERDLEKAIQLQVAANIRVERELNRLDEHAKRIDDLYRHIGMEKRNRKNDQQN